MSVINQKRVAYLYWAVTLGTVRAAADKFDVAPSAVSRQIALLEQELASTLIERHRKGVKVTPAGEVVLRHYRESLAHQEDCLAKLSSLRGLHSGEIKLAVGEGFVGDLMSDPLPSFHRSYPNLQVSISMGGSREVLSQIEEDQAHIGLLFHPPDHPKIRTHTSQPHPLCLIVPPGHALLQREGPVSFEEAVAFPCALQESHFGVRQLLAMAEFEQRIRLDPIVVTNSIAVMKHFVRANMGVTYLPEFVVAREVDDAQLAAIEIAHPLLSAGQAQIITRLGRQLPPGPAALLQHLTAWMRAFNA
ncbi:MAG: LysR family transcriptional regulator [Pseudomonadales bacterium]